MSVTVRSKRLGKDLRDLREAAALSPQDAIRLLGWSRAKLDRIESGATVPKLADLQEALTLYGADSAQLGALTQLRNRARQRGWWTSFGDVFTGSYVALEWDASEIFEFQSGVIPGLLQTEAYARALITAAAPKAPADRIDRAVQARMARRTLVTRDDNPPQLHVVLDEAVLRRQVGGSHVMRRQVSYLWEMSRRPNVALQVVPFGAGAHAASGDSFIKLTFPGELNHPPVAYFEGLAGDVYLETPPELDRITLAERAAVDTALGPDESAALLVALADEE